MSDPHHLIGLVAETQGQITKAGRLLAKAAEASPSVLDKLVEPTRKLRDDLAADLDRLERELEKHGL